MLVEADFREGNAINGPDKRNRSEQDRISGVPIATREREDSSQHRRLLWTAVLLILISINISKHLHVIARLVNQ